MNAITRQVKRKLKNFQGKINGRKRKGRGIHNKKPKRKSKEVRLELEPN